MAEGTDSATKVIACPRCAAAVMVDQGWVSWCELCGWNVDPVPPEPPRSVVEKLWRKLSVRHRRKLFEELKGRDGFARRWSGELVLAFVLAAVVHATSLALVVLGMWWVVTLRWGFLWALLPWFAAWILAPRWPRAPKEPLNEREFPHLYALVRRTGQSVGMRPVRHIVIDERWNASFSESGWRLSPVIHLGLPLCVALDDDEFVALVA